MLPMGRCSSAPGSGHILALARPHSGKLGKSFATIKKEKHLVMRTDRTPRANQVLALQLHFFFMAIEAHAEGPASNPPPTHG